MKFKTTWLLLAAFAGLGAYLRFVDDPRRQAREKAKGEEGLLFPGFDPAKVTELSLDGPEGRVRLVRGEGDAWNLEEPVRDAADGGRVRNLLEDLKVLAAEKEAAPAGAALGPFGLDEPRRVLRARGSEAALALGSENPAGDGRYVRAGEGSVRVAKSQAVAGLLSDPQDLRSKDVFGAFPWARLRTVVVSGPGRETVRLRKGGQTWAVEGPRGGEADPEAVQALEEKLRGIRVASFLREPPGAAEARFAKGTSVAVEAEGREKPALLRLVAVGGELWAATSEREAVFTVPREVVEALPATPERLLRRRPALAKAWSVERLEVAAAGRRLSYDKADGAWRRGGAAVAPKELAALEGLLRVLEEARASRLVRTPAQAAEYGLAAPSASLDLTDSLHGRQTVAVGKKGATVFAQTGGAGAVYEMPADYLGSVEGLLSAAASPAAAAAPSAGKP